MASVAPVAYRRTERILPASRSSTTNHPMDRPMARRKRAWVYRHMSLSAFSSPCEAGPRSHLLDDTGVGASLEVSRKHAHQAEQDPKA